MLTTLIVVLAIVLVLFKLAIDLIKEGPLSKHEPKHKRVLITLLICAALVAIILPIATLIQKNREKKAADAASQKQQQQQALERQIDEQKAEQARAQQETEAHQKGEQQNQEDETDPARQGGFDAGQGEHHPLRTLKKFFWGEGQYLIGNHPPGFYSAQVAPPPPSKQYPHQAEMSPWMEDISSAMSTNQLLSLGPRVLEDCEQAPHGSLGLPFRWFYAMKDAYSREYGGNAWNGLQEGVPSKPQYWTEPDPGDDTNAHVKQYGCQQVQAVLAHLHMEP